MQFQHSLKILEPHNWDVVEKVIQGANLKVSVSLLGLKVLIPLVQIRSPYFLTTRKSFPCMSGDLAGAKTSRKPQTSF